MAFSLGIRF